MTEQMFPLLISLLTQLISGLGLLAATNTRMVKSAVIPLAILLGMFAHTVAMFALQLVNVPLTLTSTLLSGAGCAILCNVLIARTSSFLTWFMREPHFNIKMYDLVVIGFAASVGYIVVWASWYWPVTPFDAMAGIDLVARHTVAEGNIVNRVFTDPSLAGNLSNQPFYAPFAMLMQVMYRLIGFEYGQVWLGIVAVCFSWFMYSTLRQYCHPFIANALWLLFILTPEMLGYTYLLQTDYLNAVFFAAGAILLLMHLDSEKNATLFASIVFFAAACWSRTETVAIVGLSLLFVVPVLWKRLGSKATIKYAVQTMVVCVVIFALWHVLFFRHYLPVYPDSSAELVGFSFEKFLNVISSTFSNVIFDKGLWGAAFVLFTGFVVVDAVYMRKFNNATVLLVIAAVFVGLVFIGTVFSSAVVAQTLRRGVFKIIPLMFVYVASTTTMKYFSDRLLSWEQTKK